MSCVIEVVLKPEGPVEAGSEVTVRVSATSSEPARCREVSCSAAWSTGGRGEKDGEAAFVRRVPGAEMAPGVALEREFRFTVPAAGPVTYHGLRFSRGSLLSIDWTVRVRLSGTWSTDPERAASLVVVPRTI
jgi:hypothetical protein